MGARIMMQDILLVMKQALELLAQVLFCVFMFVSFFRFITLDQYFTMWSISFVLFGVCHIVITLLRIFAILFRIDLNQEQRDGIGRPNRRVARNSQKPDETE